MFAFVYHFFLNPQRDGARLRCLRSHDFDHSEKSDGVYANMNKIRKEVDKMQTQPMSEWKGSLQTADHVREEIRARWGDEEAEKYNPLTNCFTYNTWRQKGYTVKSGEHGIRSFTIKTVTVEEDGKPVEKRYAKTCYLFYYLQVSKR